MRNHVWKRMLCFILAVSLIATMLSGCGGPGKDDTATMRPSTGSTGDSTPDSTPSTPDSSDPDGSGSADLPLSQSQDTQTPSGGQEGDIPQYSGIPASGDPTAEPVTSDPWALTPAPTAAELLESAFPLGKTMHATMAMTMSGAFAFDLGAMAEAGWTDESGESLSMDPEDMKFSMYMTIQLSQDGDTLYMEGTAQSVGMGENATEAVKGYSTRNADGTIDTYTFDSTTQAWIVSHDASSSSFGVESLMSLGSAEGVDPELFEMQTTDTEYILTATTTNDVLGSLTGGTSASMDFGDMDASTGITPPATTVTLRFDKATREIRSFMVVMEPTFLLFINLTNMTMALANVSFDTADVSVPNDVKIRAVEETTIDSFGE